MGHPFFSVFRNGPISGIFCLLLLLGSFFVWSCGSGGSDAGDSTPGGSDYTPSCSGESPLWRSTPDYPSVSACVSQASSGDTINITAGQAIWQERLSLGAKKLFLIGAGIDATVIRTNLPDSWMTHVIHLGTGGSRIAHLTVDATTGVIIADGQGFVVDHIKFTTTTAGKRAMVVNRSGVHPTGVVHSCQFVNTSVLVGGGGTGMNSQSAVWSEAQTMGSEDGIVFFEGNTFNRTNNGTANAIDGNYGVRYVFRYNDVISTGATQANSALYIEAHSVQWVNRAVQRWEVYNNIIDNRGAGHYYPFRIRAGTGLIFNNTVLGNWTNFGIALDNVRCYARADFSGKCDGTSYWDGNEGTGAEAGYPCRDQIGRGHDTEHWRSFTIESCSDNGTGKVRLTVTGHNLSAANKATIIDSSGLSGCGSGFTGGTFAIVATGANTLDIDLDYTGPKTGNGYILGRPTTQPLMPAYAWNNKKADGTTEVPFHVINDSENHIQANRDYYNFAASFDGTTGIGRGLLSARPAACTINTAYFATDRNPLGTLYKCVSTNTWTAYFQPTPCPHPLSGLSGTCTTEPGTAGYNR